MKSEERRPENEVGGQAVYCIHPVELAGWLLQGLNVTPGLQEGHNNVKRSDLLELERLEFRTSFR